MSERTRETTGTVAESVRQMYAALGDPQGFDRYLHPEITIWETDQPGPRIGLRELDALRGRRSPDEPTSRPDVSVEDLLVDRWAQVSAVARYVLVARAETGDTRFRVTDVWDFGDDGWRIVHHHAEETEGEAAPDAGRTTA